MKYQRMQLRGGFTLIELLVVVAIVLVLAALLFPAFKRFQENAGGATCAGNQKNILAAFMSYAGENNGTLPPYGDINAADRDWWKLVRPYLDAGDTQRNAGINWMRCPTQKDKTRWATYGVNYGYSIALPVFSYEGGFYRGSLRVAKLTPGTMLIGDLNDKSVSAAIYSPLEWPFDYDENKDGVKDSCSSFNEPYNYLGMRHGGAANGGFADGSVRKVTPAEWGKNAGGLWGPIP
jgi:prepilin-type N-terminal cleavage/methylation domain-containing protein/prepilin-type processing-associated H-X9-DG protein